VRRSIRATGNLMSLPTTNRVRTPTLEIAYEEAGPSDGMPVILLHGFPYDPRCYDEVVQRLVAAGCRTLVPYLRGYGPTKFLSPDTPRSGQQAALGNDLEEFMDALGLKEAALAGYDIPDNQTRIKSRFPVASQVVLFVFGSGVLLTKC
jgi:pimeloyl-ACP methyl ester carboxylesterase